MGTGSVAEYQIILRSYNLPIAIEGQFKLIKIKQ